MIDIKKLSWFCPQPFINTVCRPRGGAARGNTPCCVMKGTPKSLKDFRQEFLNGGGPLSDKHCLVCKEQEKHSKTESHRLIYTGKFNEGRGQYGEHRKTLEENVNVEIEEQKILTMEYKAPTNFCNLKCNMCGPGDSSTYAKENRDIGIANSRGIAEYLQGKVLRNDPDDVSKYTEMLKNIIELKLVGGETLAQVQNYKLMQHAIDLDVAKNIGLVITTNATLTPKFDGKDIFDLIPHFKNCQMNVSVEFWGHKNDYLRFPSKWQNIMKNVRRFAEMPDTDIMFASTVNALNIGYLNEVADGIDLLRDEHPSGNYHHWATGSLVIGDGSLYKISAVPTDIREMYIDKFYTKTKPQQAKTFMKLCAYLTDMQFNKEDHKLMMIDVAKRDKHRGTLLTDIFPEWTPYYEKL